jgi:dihydropteroate synthase
MQSDGKVIQGQEWKVSSERTVKLDRPFLVGIVNVTPDSFADGGRYGSVDEAVDTVRRMVDDGTDAIDIGGESTRPGAVRVESQEQIKRVVPVIEGVRSARIDVLISVDTTLSDVARAALKSGADAINDVSAATEDSAMLPLAADRGCGLVLMHRERDPGNDSYSDAYQAGQQPTLGSVCQRVIDGLRASRDAAINAGVERGCIMLDPGLGFGKDVEQNLELIRATERICQLGHPVMSALSRKSFVGRVSLGRDSEPAERLAGTLGLSVVHLLNGARVFRVHDVKEHRETLDGVWALMGSSGCVDER